MTELKIHPAADLFPMMGSEELQELAADIKANGLREPVKVDQEGLLLDGRNRSAACKIAGVKPEIETVEVDDPVAYVVSLNVMRRMMTKQQTAVAAAEAWDMTGTKTGTKRGDLLAKQFGVSRGYVQMARALIQSGDAALVRQIKEGRADLSSAYEAIRELQEEKERDEEERVEAEQELRELQEALGRKSYSVEFELLEAPSASEIKVTLADLKKKDLRLNLGEEPPTKEEVEKVARWDAALGQANEVTKLIKDLPSFPMVGERGLIAIQTAEIARLLGDASARLLKAIPKTPQLRSVK